jgi:hypothetical protein
MAAGYDAWIRSGDARLALELCDQSLAVEQQLGVVADAHLEVWAFELRGNVAQAVGAADAVNFSVHDLAGAARAEGLPALAAVYLGRAAQAVSYEDPVTARQLATEGLALARETGMPFAIVHNLLGLALALASADADQARTLLAEALQVSATLDYESPNELQSAIFAAARLADWPTTVRVARRLLHHQIRSGGIALAHLAAILNLVARGLAELQPEPAAVLQGSVGAMMRGLTADVVVPVSGTTSKENAVAAFVADVRRETTQLLDGALGEARVRQLRTEGAAMSEEQSYSYARTHVDEYLAAIPEEPQ